LWGEEQQQLQKEAETLEELVPNRKKRLGRPIHDDPTRLQVNKGGEQISEKWLTNYSLNSHVLSLWIFADNPLIVDPLIDRIAARLHKINWPCNHPSILISTQFGAAQRPHTDKSGKPK
jgi:hypothetical protein